MIRGENFKIMVGGKVVGSAGSVQTTFAEDDTPANEFSDHWRIPDISQSFKIIGNATIKNADGVLRGMMNDKQKWDVTIGQEVGKLPRKMKKALHSRRMTKWRHKVAAYINRSQVCIRDADIVVNPRQRIFVNAQGKQDDYVINGELKNGTDKI